MRTGIYFDLRNPPRWRRPWPAFYAQTLELIAEAERLGADDVWLSEHHFFEDGYLPQPLTFAAAEAARTERVRIGTAIMLPALRTSLQVAEEAAVVDILSNGRLDLGLGAGYRVREYQAFGADIRKRFTLTDQRAREIRQWLDGDELTPPAVQRPLPIWMGYLGPQGARRAGRLGAGLLSLGRELLGPYREGLLEGGFDPQRARMTGLVNALVSDDPETAWERVREHFAYQIDTYRAYGAEGTGLPEPEPIDPDAWRGPGGSRGGLPRLQVLTPADTVRFVKANADGLPAVGCHFWASIAGMPDDLVRRHVELVCTEVRPGLADV